MIILPLHIYCTLFFLRHIFISFVHHCHSYMATCNSIVTCDCIIFTMLSSPYFCLALLFGGSCEVSTTTIETIPTCMLFYLLLTACIVRLLANVLCVLKCRIFRLMLCLRKLHFAPVNWECFAECVQKAKFKSPTFISIPVCFFCNLEKDDML